MKTLNFGIIGCGYQTQKNMAPAMDKCECTKIQGFFDIDVAKAEKFARQYEAQSYLTLDAMLSDKTIDAVYIATPISTHEELCRKAAEIGRAHV